MIVYEPSYDMYVHHHWFFSDELCINRYFHRNIEPIDRVR